MNEKKQWLNSDQKTAIIILIATFLFCALAFTAVYLLTDREVTVHVDFVEPLPTPTVEIIEPIVPQVSMEQALGIVEAEYLSIPHSCYYRTDHGFSHVTIPDYGLVCEICGYEIKARYEFTDEDIYLLAQMSAGDRGNYYGEYDFVAFLNPDLPQFEWTEWQEFQTDLVLRVTMNRVLSDRFPNTVREVLLQQGQYEVFPRNLNAEPHELAIEYITEWCKRWNLDIRLESETTPDDHLFFAAITAGQLGNRSR